MIAKINKLKRIISDSTVKSLCETTIAAMSSAIYNNVTAEARFEIERAAIENLFEGLSKNTNPIITEWLNNEKRLYSIKNIGVRKAINALKETDAKYDDALFSILSVFEEKVNKYPEVLIYEEFIATLDNDYSWTPGVAKQLAILTEKAKTYKNDIDITKIIETMKETRSNYLLPLIEDVVNSYVANKTEQTKSHLKETLVKFSYDPYVRDIINLVMADATDLQLEYANANVDIEKVYSPIMYLGENEVAFNIKGSFYIKKGNNINKLKKSEVSMLDPQFIGLCEAVNVPNVEINKNNITVYVGNDVAVISEDKVSINTHVMNEQEFKDAVEVSQWTGNTNFFMLTEALRANFNDIVEIDFAKRVYLKENEGYSADIIKLRNNIFITTFDPINNKSTFYRNINPIQAEKIMMEHMRYDISKTFSDILPSKDKILAQIDESKQSYVDYINELSEKIRTFEVGQKNAVTKEVIAALNEELKEIKNEYKDYVNEIEQYINVSENTTVTIDVDGEKYTVPIPQKSSTSKGEQAVNSQGTIIGAENMEQSPASEITFDDSQTELLGDAPSIQDDQVDLGVDNVEAEADSAEASAENTEGEESEEGAEGGEDLGLGDEEGAEGSEDLDLGLGDEEGDEEETTDEEEPAEEEKATEEAVQQEFNPNTQLNDEEDGALVKSPLEDEQEVAPAEGTEETEEIVDDPEVSTESNPEETTGEEEVEVQDAEAKPKKGPKVFLVKKAVSENQIFRLKKKSNNINEHQIGDTVIINKSKGYIIGQTNDGDFLVQVQGSSSKVASSKLKAVGKKEKVAEPQYKFDKITQQNLTTKTLFEQYVNCGIFMNNTPIKLNNCYVKFSDWNNSKDDQPVSVIIEGLTSIMQKNQIRILENINDFANPDNYVEAVLIDERSGEAIENVLVNVVDYTNAIGDADEVRIVKRIGGEDVVSSVPLSIVKTLSV